MKKYSSQQQEEHTKQITTTAQRMDTSKLTQRRSINPHPNHHISHVHTMPFNHTTRL
jgi:hypothetical protein